MEAATAVQHSELTYEDYILDPDTGVLRQKDLTPRVSYDRDYLDYYVKLAGESRKMTELRFQRLLLLLKMAGAGMFHVKRLLDVGSGTCEFVRRCRQYGFRAFGHDLCKEFCPEFMVDETQIKETQWFVTTFFDSLEHFPDPKQIIKAAGAKFIFLSLPWCHYPDDWEYLRRWRHLKYGEHLWHWDKRSLCKYMRNLSYSCIWAGCFEDELRPSEDPGLPNILSAFFRRSRT